MKNIKDKILKSTLLIALLLISLSLTFGICFDGANAYAGATGTQGQATEEKTYCTATLDDDFDDSTVIITLTKEATRQFLAYTANDFAEVNCASVEDLTEDTVDWVKKQVRGEPTEQTMLINVEKFRRKLNLELSTKSKENVLYAVRQLEVRHDVLSASPNYILTTLAQPDDTNYNQQWGLQKISAPAAWGMARSLNTVTVGVIDSGIDASHEDLKDNISNAGWHRDYTGVGIAVNTPTDPFGHGTHVAGIIGAKGNNSLGVTGVNWDIELVSLRVFDKNGKGDKGRLQKAVHFAASKSIPILNYSGGGGPYDGIEKNEIEEYEGLFIAAAGNDGTDNDNRSFYPASYPIDNIISVGSSDNEDKKSSFSNYGATTVDIFAPGSDILSTVPGNKYKKMSGTSMAAPFVTGVAALMLSQNPYLTASQLKSAILDSADAVPSLSGLCVTDGRLNAEQALKITVPLTLGKTIAELEGYLDYKIYEGMTLTNLAQNILLGAFHIYTSHYDNNIGFITADMLSIKGMPDADVLTAGQHTIVVSNPNLGTKFEFSLNVYNYNTEIEAYIDRKITVGMTAHDLVSLLSQGGFKIDGQTITSDMVYIYNRLIWVGKKFDCEESLIINIVHNGKTVMFNLRVYGLEIAGDIEGYLEDKILKGMSIADVADLIDEGGFTLTLGRQRGIPITLGMMEVKGLFSSSTFKTSGIRTIVISYGGLTAEFRINVLMYPDNPDPSYFNSPYKAYGNFTGDGTRCLAMFVDSPNVIHNYKIHVWRVLDDGYEYLGCWYTGVVWFRTFEDIASGIRTFDYNGDGIYDIIKYRPNKPTYNLEIWISDGNGSFSYQYVTLKRLSDFDESFAQNGTIEGDGYNYAVDFVMNEDGSYKLVKWVDIAIGFVEGDIIWQGVLSEYTSEDAVINIAGTVYTQNNSEGSGSITVTVEEHGTTVVTRTAVWLYLGGDCWSEPVLTSQESEVTSLTFLYADINLDGTDDRLQISIADLRVSAVMSVNIEGYEKSYYSSCGDANISNIAAAYIVNDFVYLFDTSFIIIFESTGNGTYNLHLFMLTYFSPATLSENFNLTYYGILWRGELLNGIALNDVDKLILTDCYHTESDWEYIGLVFLDADDEILLIQEVMNIELVQSALEEFVDFDTVYISIPEECTVISELNYMDGTLIITSRNAFGMPVTAIWFYNGTEYIYKGLWLSL